jgi:hypothetical protein
LSTCLERTNSILDREELGKIKIGRWTHGFDDIHASTRILNAWRNLPFESESFLMFTYTLYLVVLAWLYIALHTSFLNIFWLSTSARRFFI